MKKSIMSLVLVFALIMGLVACGTDKKQDTSVDTPVESQSAVEDKETSEQSAATQINPEDYDEKIETDVLVIGGGGTGLTASISAAEMGKNVVLLEKMSYVGGATLMSAGKVPAAGTSLQEEAGIIDTPEALATDILRPGDYGQRGDLVELVADNSKDFIDWAAERGVNWTLETNLLYYGQTVNRMHVAEEGGIGITGPLSEKIEGMDNINLMLETKGTGLVADETGKVIGGTAEDSSGKTYYISANAVVLATSGFGANRDMVEKYVPSIANAYPMVAPGATGEGILWGVELGAGVRNMGAYQGYAPISNETKKGLGQTMINNGGFVVNAEGKRFMDEYTGYSNLAAGIVNQTDAHAFMIWDSNVAEGQDETLANWDEQGILIKADTVKDLAQAIGVDEATLQNEFDRYAEGIASGKDYLDRTALPSAFDAPYYAADVSGDFRHTQGGLTIDLTTRVLREDGSVIEGLYAGGGVTEGFSSSGGPAYMSGNGLLQALVLGRIAGEQAAQY